MEDEDAMVGGSFCQNYYSEYRSQRHSNLGGLDGRTSDRCWNCCPNDMRYLNSTPARGKAKANNHSKPESLADQDAANDQAEGRRG
jgi:hypothetical protein